MSSLPIMLNILWSPGHLAKWTFSVGFMPFGVSFMPSVSLVLGSNLELVGLWGMPPASCFGFQKYILWILIKSCSTRAIMT